MWPFSTRKERPTHRSFRPSRRLRLEALEDRCCPSGGQLDPTFGGGTGTVNLPASTLSEPLAMAIQPQDGKIVTVVGFQQDLYSTRVMSVARLNPDGTPDTSFNKTGSVHLQVGVYAQGHAVALQPDGKVLVGGIAYQKARDEYTNDEFVVARFNANGTLDTTFASKGVFTWNPTSGGDEVLGLAVLPNGNIVAGSTSIFELSPGGALIASFGNGGLATLPASGEAVTSLAVVPNGDIILAGNYGTLAALNPSTGQLDPNFNNGQGWINNFNPPGDNATYFNRAIIQGNSILVAGSTQNPNGVVGLLGRFTLTGAVDTSFATGGFFTTTTRMRLYDIALEPDGSIVVDGQDYHAPDRRLPVAHFTADGHLDTTFGGAGTGFNFLSGGSSLGGLGIDAGGRIVALGYATSGTFLARLTPPEAMIGSFTASANPVTFGGNEALTASNIAGDGATITQVAFYYLDGSGTQVVLGYGSQTSPGVWTDTFTVSLAPGRYTLYAQAEDSNLVFGDPDALTLTVQ
jgi:uncharacterized delta-60 repeat protein